MAQQDTSLPLTDLTAITPLDGRYRNRIHSVAKYTSEHALIKTRFEVEAKYLIALSEVNIIRKLSDEEKQLLNFFSEKITPAIAQEVKQIEQQTRHDVKAMERVFRKLVQGTSLEDIIEMIHIGLTSEDINNLSYRLMLKRATDDILIGYLEDIVEKLVTRAERYKSTPMLARTHGQPAVPTTLGKELVIFAYRLHKELYELRRRNLTGKLSGAVGNFNALVLAYPDADWIQFSHNFINSLGLIPNLVTTQINTYEDIVSYCQNLHRINSIIIDFNQDMWRYISDNWFVQEVKKGEVGSSTMPQKVNPIDFENSEGNLGMANALLEHFARKLPISRLQRDLSDSTTIRNLGTLLGYCSVGYSSLITGLVRVTPDIEKLAKELDDDWSILAEGVQTILRKEQVKDPYSLIASLIRGEHIDESTWKSFIEKLQINQKQKQQLLELTPTTYIGLATKICEKTIEEIKAAH